MERTLNTATARADISTEGQPLSLREAREAHAALRLGFTIAPIVAGADKFFNAMVDWTGYLHPEVARRSPGGAEGFMRAVGAIEIAAGVLCAVKPRIGGMVVSAWLAGIVGNLVSQRRFYDIALRDVGLAIGAFALARLSAELEEHPRPRPGRVAARRESAKKIAAARSTTPL